VLLAAALGIGTAKAAIVAASLLACGVPRRTALGCGLGLANVGELGFVLLSRARAVGLLSKPLFLLLLGSTALSLAATPAVSAAGLRVAGLGRRRGRRISVGGEGWETLPVSAAPAGFGRGGLRVRDPRRIGV